MKRLFALMLCALSLGVMGQEECNDVSPFLTAVEQVPLELLGMSDSTMFFKSEDSLNWQEAQDYSSFLGGHLATFSSSEEYDLIQTTWSSPFGLWFGLRQNVFDEEPAGGWGWVTNEDSTFSAWGSSEPNNGPNINYSEDCGEIVEGFWNDAWCLVTRRFIIEVPISKVRCSEQAACNFDPEATIDDGSCYSCDIPESHCGPGTIWDAEMQLCIIANPADINLDGCVQLGDLLDLLAAYGDCGAEESVWQCGDPVSYQGYDYQTVQSGEQCWFAENLRAENYRNGDVIPAGLSDSEWASTTAGAVTLYGEGEDWDCQSFSPEIDACDYGQFLEACGLLYNWYAVDDERVLCPNGWHIPSDEDWLLMEFEIGGIVAEGNDTGWFGSNRGAQMKTITGWFENGNGSNLSGFSGMPSGGRLSGYFFFAGKSGHWWSSSSYGGSAWYRGLRHDQEGVYRSYHLKNVGFSVRCLKD